MSEVEVPRLPEREPDAHKGDFGRVLVVAGSRGMVGAACLTASSALRAGAGLVKLAVPESLWDVVATKLTCIMTLGLPETAHGVFAGDAAAPLMEEARWADVVALGPGIGRFPETRELVHSLVAAIDRPLVMDADALFHLAGSLDLVASRRSPTILTPHPGEMARLADCSVADVQAAREKTASDFAAGRRVVCVLKGAGTVVSDGERTCTNATGNSGMATGGTGDVLTGVIAGLLGQGVSAFDAAVLGVYLHGLAGDLAVRMCGVHGLTAADVLDLVPAAFIAHASE